MRRIFMVMVALLGLSIVGMPVGAAYASEGGGEHGGSGGEGGKEGAKPAGPTFVKMDPLVVPVVDSEGASQTISLVVAFEVENAEAATKIDSLKPRIKDAFIENLYGMLNTQVAMEKGVLKVAYVKQRLNEIAIGVLGEGVVKSVLLQMVQQNPL